MNADKLLEEAAKTFREKNKVYGDNYKRVGEMMAGMFPAGVTLKTAHDWNRMHILLLCIVKLTRYAVNWEKGHKDSVHDLAVYAAMLESIDEDQFPR